MAAACTRQLSDIMLQVLCSLACISLLLAPAGAIKCHQCNSMLHEGCDDITKINSTYLLDCIEYGDDDGSGAFCRKLVQKVLVDGSSRTIRTCGWEKSRQTCYRNDDDDHSEIVCECFEEACNSAPRRLAALLSPVLFPAFLARL